MILVNSKKVGKKIGDFIITKVFYDDDGKMKATGICASCGKETLKTWSTMSKGAVCKCQKHIGKYNGEVINGFEVLDGYCKPSKTGKSKAIVYIVKCIDCGQIQEKYKNCLFNGIVTCDCKKMVRCESDGRLFGIWKGMKDRCLNEKSESYNNYGGRGITICDEWLKDFKCFREWSYEYGYREDLSIDRINNDGNYEPNNCRWATRIEQGNNRRTNHLITLGNTTMTMADWARITGTPERTLWARLQTYGWTDYDALTKPIQPKGNTKRKVNQYTREGVFIMQYESIRNASSSNSVDASMIIACCKGKQKTAGGFRWEYVE